MRRIALPPHPPRDIHRRSTCAAPTIAPPTLPARSLVQQLHQRARLQDRRGRHQRRLVGSVYFPGAETMAAADAEMGGQGNHSGNDHGAMRDERRGWRIGVRDWKTE